MSVRPIHMIFVHTAHTIADGLENTWQEFQKAVLTRWTLDLDSGEMTKEQLDDRSVEFPRIDERRLGRDAL